MPIIPAKGKKRDMAAIAITAANVAPSAKAIYLQGLHYSLYAIPAGSLVYQASTIANPSAATPDIGVAGATGTGIDQTNVIGIAATSAPGPNQRILIVLRDPAFAIGGTVNAGDVVYLHPTGGAMTSAYSDVSATGSFVCVIGVGIGGNQINFGGTQTLNKNWAGVIRADAARP